MSNNIWTDWEQNRRLADAEDRLAAERRARSNLVRQVRAQQGNMQEQIDRLTRAFVALVEHEDIRAELGQYADAAGCRRYAREVVATVVVTGGAALRGSVEVPDVPGYWLAAAARGVAATARGDEGGEALLVEARHRDPRRTSYFLALLGAQTRDPRWAPARLDAVLPDGSTVSATQRQLWLAVAEGRLTTRDGDATDQLVGALEAQVAASGAVGRERLTAWLSATAGKQLGGLPAEQAVRELATLRSVLESGSTQPEEPESAVDSFLRGASGQSDADVAPVPEDPLADCLRSLVDEGAPAEGDILDRMAAVRAELGFLDERTATMAAAWSASAGDVVELLVTDLEQPAGTGRADLARRVLGPTLRGIALELAQAAAAPPAATRPLHVVGATITVAATGATGAWRPDITAAVVRRNPVNPVLLPMAAGLLAVGVVCAGLAFLASGWIVLALSGILGGLGTLFVALRERRDLAAFGRSTMLSTDREIETTSARIVEEDKRSAVAANAAHEHLRAIDATFEAAV